MGNRAHVIFTDKTEREISPAIYLHWNGGPESVYAFLDEMTRRKCRRDTQYAPARFVHVVGDFFDQKEADSLSLGITNGPRMIDPSYLKPYDHGDNGIYVVSPNDKGWHVRRFCSVEVGRDAEGMPRYELTEADPEAVANERDAAQRHEYNIKQDGDGETLVEVFARLRPTISKYG